MNPVTIGLAAYSLLATLFIIFVRRRQLDKQDKKKLRYEIGSYNALLSCIETLEIDRIQKVALKERYVEKSSELRKIALDAKKAQGKIDTYNIALSATITVLTAAEPAVEGVLPFISVGLCVAILSSFNTFLLSYSAQNGLKEKWLDNRQASELLESELWMYLTRSDEYVGKAHRENAAMAILNNERVILSNVEKQVMAARQRQQKKNDSDVGIDINDNLTSEITVRTSPAPTSEIFEPDSDSDVDIDGTGTPEKSTDSKIAADDQKTAIKTSGSGPIPPPKFSPIKFRLNGEDEDV